MTEMRGDVALTLDRRNFHIRLILICRDNGIHLVALSAQAPHFIQSLDVEVFGPDAHYLGKPLVDWQSKAGNSCFFRNDFVSIYGQALFEAYTEQNVKTVTERRASGPKIDMLRSSQKLQETMDLVDVSL